MTASTVDRFGSNRSIMTSDSVLIRTAFTRHKNTSNTFRSFFGEQFDPMMKVKRLPKIETGDGIYRWIKS